jgi:addiction module HigA family antidote
MLMTKRKPSSVGEVLIEEFMKPLGLTQGQLAQAMGVPRKHVNELCNDRRAITADTALMLARVFGNSADFWLNAQRCTDLWEALRTAGSASTARGLSARPPPDSGCWRCLCSCRGKGRVVIASAAKQSSLVRSSGLLRRSAPRNDGLAPLLAMTASLCSLQ